MTKPKFDADQSLTKEADAAIEEIEKRALNPNSLANIRPRAKGEQKKKTWLQLNIADYEDYLYRIAKVNEKSMTQYVMDLIAADQAQNAEAYKGLKLLKVLDKPEKKKAKEAAADEEL